MTRMLDGGDGRRPSGAGGILPALGLGLFKLVFLLLGVAFGAARLVPSDAGADAAASAPVDEGTQPSRAGAAA